MLVKIDVEGFEPQVIEGMKEFLGRNQVYLLLEINNGHEEMLKRMQDLGFARLEYGSEDHLFTNEA